MKPKERDELLGRLDERSRNTYHLVEKLEKHNAEQNGYILDLVKQSSSNKTSIKWIVRVLVAAGILGGGATGIVNLIG
ncbi:hypothetical protein LCGC14_0384650 [marine sediment metagenome]|uniref:Uncharacterized protein n=1 Tax=marine sediment metagenome TaxID=412755 RepID=A0A0F9WA31_9ZZZZ